MRPRTHRRFVMLFIAGWLTAAILTTAGVARADIDPDVAEYAIDHTALICNQIAADPTIAGLDLILVKIQVIGGWTPYESGEIIAAATTLGCPRFWPLLKAYAAIYGGTQI